MSSDKDIVLHGLWLPLITPLRGGRIDLNAVQDLTQYYENSGIAGLVLFGSTGEGNLVSMNEKFQIVEAVRNVAPRIPIVIGVGGVDPQGVYHTIRKLDRLAPDGWLVPPPYYLRPAPEGILWHYQQVAWATNRPIIIYNVPKRTGVALTVELMECLCENSNCVAVKECDPVVLAAINARQRLVALCGEDMMFLDHFLQRGAGAIAASAHIRPDIFMAVMTLAGAGRNDEAKALFHALRPVVRLLCSEPNPGPIKKVLSSTGIIANELRLPMTPASELLGNRLLNAISKLPSKQDVGGILAGKITSRMSPPGPGNRTVPSGADRRLDRQGG